MLALLLSVNSSVALIGQIMKSIKPLTRCLFVLDVVGITGSKVVAVGGL